jgi:hypothetical protein
LPIPVIDALTGGVSRFHRPIPFEFGLPEAGVKASERPPARKIKESRVEEEKVQMAARSV